MYIFGGIDGTGTSNDSLYRTEFTNSFVRQLWRSGGPWRNSYYVRGPRIDGSDTYSKARILKDSLKPHLKDIREGKVKLVLAGYSRGGAAVTKLCAELDVNVEALLLFDAVDMTHTLNAEFVPANVKNCFHAIRHPGSYSRHTWGNCALKAADRRKTNFVGPKPFMCTHGGMGGVPWPMPKGAESELIDETAYDKNSTVARATRYIPNIGPIPIGPMKSTAIRALLISAIRPARPRSRAGCGRISSLC